MVNINGYHKDTLIISISRRLMQTQLPKQISAKQIEFESAINSQ